MRAGGAVQAGERPTRLAHQDVEGREIPYKHLDAISLVIGLGDAGINVLGARNSALRNLVAEMPPPVVANLLGYSHSCTQRHAQLAGQPWSRYIT